METNYNLRLIDFLKFSLVPLIIIMAHSCSKKKEISQVPPPPVVESVAELPAATSTGDSLWAIYERSPCFGMCPYFNLKIYDSGFAEYEGKNFVKNIGYYHTTFELASLQKLMSVAESINYFSLKDTYDESRVTDLPTVTTGFKHNGKMKKVAARYKAPRELETLYQAIDSLLEAANWKATEIKSKSQ